MITFVIFASLSSTWLCTLNIGQLLTLYKSLSLLVSEQRRERADAAEESQHRAAHLAPQLLLPITHTNQRPASPSKQTQEIKDKFQHTESSLCWSPYPSLWPERSQKKSSWTRPCMVESCCAVEQLIGNLFPEFATCTSLHSHLSLNNIFSLLLDSRVTVWVS